MKMIWAILKREYLERVRTKAFIIGTLLAPILFFGFLMIPILLTTWRQPEERRIAVVDPTGRLAPALDRTLNQKSQAGRNNYRIVPVAPPANNPDSLKQSLRAQVLANQLDGYIWAASDLALSGQAEYHAKNVSDFIEVRQLSTALTNAVVAQRLDERGLDPAEVNRLIAPVKLRTVRVSPEGEREDRGSTFFLAYVLVFVFYFSFALYGVNVMRSVIDDKANRIVELLLASVRPFQLMAGKILGMGAMGLTQYAIWVLMGVGMTALGLTTAARFGRVPEEMPALPPSVLIYFGVFFVLGYFLYATLFAALGAMVNTEQEAQQIQIVLVSFLIVPLLLILPIARAPSSHVSIVLSLIPVFTPILMFLRITILPPPAYQILLSLVLLVAANLGVLWLAARIFRVGILMYGKRPTLPELVKWVRYR